MGRSREIDERDMRLLKLLYSNPTLTQVELAKMLGLTQAAVSLRLKRLKRLGIIRELRYAIDPFNIGLEVTGVDVHVKDTSKMVSKFMNCPCMINIFSNSNRIFLLMAGNDKGLLESCISRHINRDDNVIDTIPRMIKSTLEPINNTRVYDYGSGLNTTPCGDICNECKYYVDNGGRCPGCPVTVFYKG